MLIKLLITSVALAIQLIAPQYTSFQVRTVPFDSNYEFVKVNVGTASSEFYVNYEQAGQDLYVECFANNFLLTKASNHLETNQRQGYIEVYMDNRKVDTFYSTAFIIKSLPLGTTKLKVVLVDANDLSLKEQVEFEVSLNER